MTERFFAFKPANEYAKSLSDGDFEPLIQRDAEGFWYVKVFRRGKCDYSANLIEIWKSINLQPSVDRCSPRDNSGENYADKLNEWRKNTPTVDPTDEVLQKPNQCPYNSLPVKLMQEDARGAELRQQAFLLEMNLKRDRGEHGSFDFSEVLNLYSKAASLGDVIAKEWCVEWSEWAKSFPNGNTLRRCRPQDRGGSIFLGGVGKDQWIEKPDFEPDPEDYDSWS